MAHNHNVYDTNVHFVIDPLTRTFSNEAGTKMVVIQYDHNSERVTFEIPREIDGHDMFLCNVVQVHYLNVSTDGRTTAPGLYEVQDLAVNPENENIVTGTWLISRNATQLVGPLSFLIRFACIVDGEEEYAWNSGICSDLSVSNGLYNSEIIVEEYADILEQWRQKLINNDSPDLEYYVEQDGGGIIANGVNPDNEIWKNFNARFAFGMDTGKAPVPLRVKGQMLVDGTVIARNVAANTNDLVNNRWGMHIFEGYATDDYSRFTILTDKHTNDSLKMAEAYYYTGAGHSAADYGWVKLGSDVCRHSFDFRRDIMQAHGMIDCRMPITLARISLTDDLDTSCETVEEADAKYEGESNWQNNLRCLKYIYLKNAENGAMFYDTDINEPVIKVDGNWHTIPTVKIEDARYLVLGQQIDPRPCTGVSLSESALSLSASESATLVATVTPENTTDALTWETSDDSVAIVSDGVVTATGNGNCTITARCGEYNATCAVTVAIVDNIPTENLTVKFTANGWDGANGAWVADIPEGTVNAAGKYSPGEGYGFEIGNASKGNKVAVGANFSGDYTIVSRQLFTQEYFDANVASDVFLFQLHAEGATELGSNPRVDVAAFNNGKATYRAYNSDGSTTAMLHRNIPAFTAGAQVAVNWAFVHEHSGAWRLYADGNLIKSGTDSAVMPDVAMELWMPGVLGGVYASHPYVKHQSFIAYNVAKTDEEVIAVHTALDDMYGVGVS